jgi:hypothetical protein
LREIEKRKINLETIGICEKFNMLPNDPTAGRQRSRPSRKPEDCFPTAMAIKKSPRTCGFRSTKKQVGNLSADLFKAF